jgi:membrane associated rhomboid family serine protease
VPLTVPAAHSHSHADGPAAEKKAEAQGEDEEFAEEDELLEDEEPSPYTLYLGNGLHPVQWVTHNFLHIDIFHLIGNMIFLWAFGIIVEGKIGWLPFLGVYLGIGTLHGALVQTVTLGFVEGGSAVGASAVIFGLMAMCLVWAPKNDLSCFVFFIIGFRIIANMWDIPILWFCAFKLVMEGIDFALSGFGVGSALGHLSGALWGTAAGVVMLKAHWVDCENWDVFALAGRRLGKTKEQAEKERRVRPAAVNLGPATKKSAKEWAIVVGAGSDEAPAEERGAEASKWLKKRLDQGDSAAALAVYQSATRTIPGWTPPEPDHYALIKALHAADALAESIAPMKDYIRRYPKKAIKAQLKLAQILINDRQRPGQALRVLGEVPKDALNTPDLEKAHRQLVRMATKMQEEGVLELEGDD